MKSQRIFYLGLIFTFLLIAINSCTKDYLEKPPLPPKPRVGVESDSLNARYTGTSITSVNAAKWNEADYLVIELQDLSTQNLYDDDGCLNLTGTHNGLTDFNDGNAATLTLKAAYDSTYLYLLAEWNDDVVDISRKTWLWDGPADPLKADNSNGWTSQKNDDKIALAFDINGASTSLGPFATLGCAASCHSSGGSDIMAPESGKVDIWNWSPALSEPFGYAMDMMSEATSGLGQDAGQKMFERNNTTPNDNRSGPAYEWDGVAQSISKPLGGNALLDPGLFLLNKIAFTGDPTVGAVIYVDHDQGCEGCHGAKGNGFGDNGDGPPFNTIEFSRKFSRTALFDFANSDEHEGKSYAVQLNSGERNNLLAYIRGLAGVPGYYLVEPVVGESTADIVTHSNMNLARVNTNDDHGTYKVMFKRKHDTGNDDDILFDLSSNQAYPFGVALMDNDGKNHVGSLLEQLIFIEK